MVLIIMKGRAKARRRGELEEEEEEEGEGRVLLDGWLLAQQHYCWFRIAQQTNFAPLYHSDYNHIV